MKQYKIKGYVAKDKDGALFFGIKKPTWYEDEGIWCDFAENIQLPSDWYPELKYTDEPVETELMLVANTPKGYKESMKVEYKELCARRLRLDSFFMTDLFILLPEEKKALLKRQFKAMTEYRDILAERMKLEGIL